MKERLIVKKWNEFQHYNTRRPPWIKLHRVFLDDFDFHCLPVASRALAPMLWLLASESDDGSIVADVKEIAFRTHTAEAEVEAGLSPLIEKGFFVRLQDASNTLALGQQSACLETEAETEAEREKEKNGASRKSSAKPKSASVKMPEGFQASADHVRLAASLAVNLDEEFPIFVESHTAKESRFVSWNAALNTWIRNSAKYAKRGKPNGKARMGGFDQRDYNAGTGGFRNDLSK